MIVNDNEIANEGEHRKRFRAWMDFSFWVSLMIHFSNNTFDREITMNYVDDGFGSPFSYITDPKINLSILERMLKFESVRIELRCLPGFINSYFKYTNSWITVRAMGTGSINMNYACLSLGG